MRVKYRCNECSGDNNCEFSIDNIRGEFDLKQRLKPKSCVYKHGIVNAKWERVKEVL